MNISDSSVCKENTEKAANETERSQEIEENESLVVLQFTDPDDANYCHKFSNKFKSLDIGGPNPVIQIGNRLYTGEYINNIGTYLLFEEESSTLQVSNGEEIPKDPNFNYTGKTFKKLVLSRLFVEEKT